ncbi:ARP2/3 complex 16 kDa subunit (p16-Arc)-domain-containing protein [Lentinula aciculospora]|uniref:Actin-related protein 2/3 complex subunit 5 n=1 Tax=Lentinula aciculospora TaxID=153920 RepID=A0A9W9ARM1_9AGAR|nr:ARP2/3 complex 16 kDa subunit (p16-Arc)-domain-containing protein [Lentinula aciculospora]KAJ4488508.1 ARP2/3 complex 16 kDa subunit (p16-Arc)-domain-containing protein [Lentinula aciculospora]
MDVAFRKIDIDAYDEDAIQESELYEADPRDPGQVLEEVRAKQVAARSLLAKNDTAGALTTVLENAPYGPNVEDAKTISLQTLLNILNSTKSTEIPSVLKALSMDSQDTLMKYLYKGMAMSGWADSNASVLLSWHEKGPSQSSRRGQAMSSTHEAFSIPTSSPVFSSHPDAFTPDVLNTPDTSRSASYTYPPPSPAAYSYVSTFSNSRPNSLLPTHHDQFHTPILPRSAYPPLTQTWNRLRTWLSREYPELGDTLNYGILPQDLAQIELQFGFPLPAVVRESYLVADGQEAESAAGCAEGLFFGLFLLPLEDVLEEWRFWREVDDDPNTGANAQLREAMQSIPPNWIRREYSQRGWIPLVADKTGNYVGIDLNPGDSGTSGQVIVFGRDFDTKVVLFNGDGPAGWARWLASFVEELESGEGYEIGKGEDNSDSEDDVGFHSYYNDGSGSGDGGGDNGLGGGLRLTGEYRGWSVLEAWADKSVRKWYEVGVIKDTIDERKGKKAEKVSPLDLSQSSAAEVPIPVLADVDGVEASDLLPDDPVNTPTNLKNSATTNNRRPPPNLPTISITKPPMPLPVELPTPRDIVALPSPPDSRHSSFDEDLESGRARGISEISTDNISTSRRASPADASPVVTSPPSPPPEDLLADSDSVLETTPIIQAAELSSPDSTEVTAPEPSQPESLVDTSSDSALVPEERVKDAESANDPNVTIRLVGGGGSSGDVAELAKEEPIVDGTDIDADVASLASTTSVASESSPSKNEKKHKKTRSGLAGLKKLALGGKKKGSVGSVKEAVTDPKQ